MPGNRFDNHNNRFLVPFDILRPDNSPNSWLIKSHTEELPQNTSQSKAQL